MPPGIYKRTKKHIEKIKSIYREGNSKMGFQKGHKDFVSKEIRKKAAKKISKSLKGYKQTEEHARKSRNVMKGRFTKEKHWNWKGGKSFEPYDQNWTNKFKRAIRKRDNQICMLCGIHREKLSRALDVHHINYDKLMSIPQNCISLCKKCHMKTNFDRVIWTKHFQSLLTKNYGYKYSENQEIILEVENK